MTTTTRLRALLLASAAVAAVASAAPAQAMTLPETGPRHLTPTGPTETYDSRAFEEAVAACMRDRGFDYEPHLYTVETLQTEDDVIGLQMETYTGGEDPNDAIVAGLTPQRRAAYFRALHGPVNPLDAQGYPTGRSLGSTDGSCTGQAG